MVAYALVQDGVEGHNVLVQKSLTSLMIRPPENSPRGVPGQPHRQPERDLYGPLMAHSAYPIDSIGGSTDNRSLD